VKAGSAFDRNADDRSGRVDAVDCARGLALIGMAVYHLSWDLADFHLIREDLPFTPPMRLLSHSVASVFLALVGVSLALAHQNGLNWRAFLRRLAIIGAAAALVTGASLVFAAGAGIFFGILHCIAVASLLAAPFVAAPAWASLAVGLAAIVAPALVHSRLFDPPWFMWLGLGEALPNTVDWRPLLPWAGVVFVGLGVARARGVLARLTSPKRWRAASAPWRAICFAGRHSLPIYLVHQPILIGIVYALTAWGGLAPKPDDSAFLAECQRACVVKGREADDCESSCRCVADAIERSGESDRLTTLGAASRARLQTLADACMRR
jgi:uncharacterized membrane protein